MEGGKSKRNKRRNVNGMKRRAGGQEEVKQEEAGCMGLDSAQNTDRSALHCIDNAVLSRRSSAYMQG